MKKVVFLLMCCVCFFSFGSFAQTYQQPQWLMPFYFEDANGDRDTVSIGYDPQADDWDVIIDPQFNEGWKWIDTTKFNVYLWEYPSYPGGAGNILLHDSVRKKDVSSHCNSTLQYYPYISIGICKGKMPITVKWDNNLLNSQYLPYPNISFRPKARVDMECNGSEPWYFPSPVDDQRIVLTDFCSYQFWLCFTDSLYINGSGNLPPSQSISGISFTIVPWDLVITNINEAVIDKSFIVSPNLVTDLVTIQNLDKEEFNYGLYNSFGQLCLFSQVNAGFNKEELSLSTFPKGMYYLKIYQYDKNSIYKIIKM